MGLTAAERIVVVVSGWLRRSRSWVGRWVWMRRRVSGLWIWAKKVPMRWPMAEELLERVERVMGEALIVEGEKMSQSVTRGPRSSWIRIYFEGS